MDGLEEIVARNVVLPIQHYGLLKRNDVSQPIRRLMLAILTDALDCLNGRAIDARGGARLQEARRAAEWVQQEADTYLFSFNSVCETLGIDPDALRQAIKNWDPQDRRLASRFHVVTRKMKVGVRRVRGRRPQARDSRDPVLRRSSAPNALMVQPTENGNSDDAADRL
jgi:hypothetical protein